MSYLVYLPLFLLLMPSEVWGLIGVIICFPIFCFLVFIFRKKTDCIRIEFKLRNLLISFLLFVPLGDLFFRKWMGSSKAASLATKIGVSKEVLISIVMVILLVSVVPGLMRIFTLLEKYFSLWTKKRFSHINHKCLLFLEIMFFSLMDINILGYSSIGRINSLSQMSLFSLIANILVEIVIMLIIHLLIKKWSITFCTSVILHGIYAIINHYVIMFHGSPLLPSEFRNTKTALAVANNYSYSIDGIVCVILYTSVILAYLAVICTNSEKGITKKIAYTELIAIVLSCICFFLITIPETSITWSVFSGIEKYGFVRCAVEDGFKMLRPFNKPEGYDKKSPTSYEQTSIKLSEIDRPDIIVILNESFYNLPQYLNDDMDDDYWNDFSSIDDSVCGSSVVSLVGGGTNNSEFELLTSCSMNLLSTIAPFTYVNFDKMGLNNVRYLKKLGYQTFAMHCCSETNYNRNKAYPEIGFDQTILGGDNFSFSVYGNRWWMDKDNFDDIISVYNKQSENPKFIYLLTYQNHGGFEQNDDALDTVHIKGNYGTLTDDINEYLTSVQKSVDALEYLIDYYKNVNRPVIICMVGDHSPSFINDIPLTDNRTEEEVQFEKLTVPFIIWSNYLGNLDENFKSASMVDIMPKVFELAGLPLSPYHKQILEVNKKIPMRSMGNAYKDVDGNILHSKENKENDELLNTYYQMEYSGLIGITDYLEYIDIN